MGRDRLAVDELHASALGDGCVLARGVGVAQHREHLLALALVVARIRATEGATEDAVVDVDGPGVTVDPRNANDHDVLAFHGLHGGICVLHEAGGELVLGERCVPEVIEHLLGLRDAMHYEAAIVPTLGDAQHDDAAGRVGEGRDRLPHAARKLALPVTPKRLLRLQAVALPVCLEFVEVEHVSLRPSYLILAHHLAFAPREAYRLSGRISPCQSWSS